MLESRIIAMLHKQPERDATPDLSDGPGVLGWGLLTSSPSELSIFSAQRQWDVFTCCTVQRFAKHVYLRALLVAHVPLGRVGFPRA